MTPYEFYLKTGNDIKGAVESNMFGKPCFKLDGKAFTSFFEDCMVFKLAGKDHKKALGLKGSKLFDPSGKKRPMKEWVQVPFSHSSEWKKLSIAAANYLKTKT
jgi:hypothetical protein